MTAGDCYRFCLSSPHVDVGLTGPASAAQLDENLAAIERGPLSARRGPLDPRLSTAVRLNRRSVHHHLRPPSTRTLSGSARSGVPVLRDRGGRPGTAPRSR